MNLNLVARLVALAVGATLVLEGVSRTASLMLRLDLPANALAFAMAGIPVVAALLLAWLMFAYARRLRFEDQQISTHGVLSAGVKLFGIYLIIEGVPLLIGTWAAGQIEREGLDFSTAYLVQSGMVGALYLAVGLVFVLRTRWVLALAMAGAEDRRSD